MWLRTSVLTKLALALVAINLFVLIWMAITNGNQNSDSDSEPLPEGVVMLRKLDEPALASTPTPVTPTEPTEHAAPAASHSATESPPPATVGRSELESGMEVNSRELTSGDRLEQLIREQTTTFETVKACYEIGPLYKQKDVESLTAGLLEIGITGKSRVVPPTDFRGYWVFLPPEKTFSLARLKLEEIKRKGATDVAIVVKEGPPNAISLGMFRNKDIAQQRQAEIEALGYKPQLEMMYRDAQRTYLGIEVDQNRIMSQERWAKILSRYTKAELIPLECAAVKKDAPAPAEH